MKILVVGLDVIAKKNQFQFDLMSNHNIEYHVIAANLAPFRKNIAIKDRQNHYEIKSPLLRIILQIWLQLIHNYSHVELYPGSRLSIFQLFLAKIFLKKVLIIERGDIGHLAYYSPFMRFNILFCYRHCKHILYKEPYMLSLLRHHTNRPCTFVHNCVSLPTRDTTAEVIEAGRHIDLVWANRDVPSREFPWIPRALNELTSQFNAALVAGIESPASYLSPPNAEYQGYIDMDGVFERSHFFLLPAKNSFGNFALLEAMANGCIPIVTKSIGIELLIKNGVNGFISDHDFESYKHCISMALSLSLKEREKISKNCIKTIKCWYSEKQYSNNLLNLYKEI